MAGEGSNEAPVMSVVVMGYQNAQTILDSIRSVLDQKSQMPFEVVVVTSGSDESAHLVSAAYPDVRVFGSSRRLMPGGARNVGLQMARGRYVAFLAADCRAAPGWVEHRMAAHLAGHAVVAGAVSATWPDRPWAWASLYLAYRERLPTSRPAGQVQFPAPAMHGLSYDRTLFQDVGPFDDTVRTGEDTDMARRLAAHGIAAWFEPGAAIEHLGPASTRALARDQRERGARFVRDTGAYLPADRRLAKLLAVEAVRTLRSIRDSARAGWRHDRLRIIVSLPWIVLGAIALRFGRVRELIRAA